MKMAMKKIYVIILLLFFLFGPSVNALSLEKFSIGGSILVGGDSSFEFGGYYQPVYSNAMCLGFFCCGDGVCDLNEVCSTCSTDCGSCGVVIITEAGGEGVADKRKFCEKQGLMWEPFLGKCVAKKLAQVPSFKALSAILSKYPKPLVFIAVLMVILLFHNEKRRRLCKRCKKRKREPGYEICRRCYEEQNRNL